MRLCKISETWRGFLGWAEPWTRHFDSSRFAPAVREIPERAAFSSAHTTRFAGCWNSCHYKGLSSFRWWTNQLPGSEETATTQIPSQNAIGEINPTTDFQASSQLATEGFPVESKRARPSQTKCGW